jgi:IS5 family transposase
VVLQSLHNLSDEQTEYLIRDRISFMRFLDLELEDPVPDASTIWLFREALAQAGLIDQLFERFGQHLQAAGYIARGGQIIDATIVSVPKQRNTREENEAIKAGKTPEGWEKHPAKNAQKDGRRWPPQTSLPVLERSSSITWPCSIVLGCGRRAKGGLNGLQVRRDCRGTCLGA